jgi:hypothetical protein
MELQGEVDDFVHAGPDVPRRFDLDDEVLQQ